jgi:predicted DNA-binding protein with PD1-like motif
MTSFQTIRSGEKIMGRLGFGCDLLEELTRISTARGISLGRIAAFGAVQKVRIGYYDQNTRVYQFLDIDKALEIVQLIGNISLKDAKPFVHAHITLADESGKTFGGHLAPGTIVFACEFIIEALEGAEFNRSFDEETGLPLWDLTAS